MFGLLSAYTTRTGDAVVPYNHVEEGENLGTWLTYQKRSKREGRLAAHKIEKLESLGVSWKPNSDHSGKQKKKQWEYMLGLLRAYRDREGDTFVSQSHVELDSSTNQYSKLGTWLDRQRRLQAQGKLNPSKEEKLRSVGVVFGMVHSQKWQDMYERLLVFCEKNGHPSVPQSYRDEDGKNLGTWINTQRQAKKHGTLDLELQEKLESIQGFCWTVSSPRWDTMINLLTDYVDREGHCNVPRDYRVVAATTTTNASKAIHLGQWVDRQRQAKRAGNLTVEREAQLESLGMVWDPTEQQWEDMFSGLRAYLDKEGHCNVPKNHKVAVSKNLGTWLHTQRRFRKLGTLDPMREARLEELGVEWDRSSSEWKRLCSLLVQYKAREGDCLVPQNHKENGTNLGVWLNNQRSKQKAGTLEDAYRKELENMGVVWDVGAEQWKTMVTLLEEYQRTNGHCRVPQSHKVDGKNLGTWLNTQRQTKRQGTLDSAKEKQLETIGVVWDLGSEKWDEMISLLLRYKEREGDCMVPQDHKEDNKALGVWLYTQRKSQKKGTLNPEKERQLTELGIVWDVLSHKWECMFSKLIQYKKREDHCNPPLSHKEDGKALGIWLDRQRKLKKAGTLDPSFEKKLESAGVVFNLNQQKWEDMFALLIDFREREGHCRVPQGHQEGTKYLGNWLDSQRQKKKKEKLDGSLQKRLESVGVEWNIYHSKSEDDDDDWGFEGMDHLFDDDSMMIH